jgi:16S rRNA processing protein RimM
VAAPGEETSAGETLAVITAIVEGGGGDLAELRLADGRVRLVPFRKEFFVDINPEKGRVTLKNLWVLE